MKVVLGLRARKDLERVRVSAERDRIVDALAALQDEAPNLDVKALQGRAGWRRLRTGHWRILYRVESDVVAVERIVNRRDLNQAVASLSG